MNAVFIKIDGSRVYVRSLTQGILQTPAVVEAFTYDTWKPLTYSLLWRLVGEG